MASVVTFKHTGSFSKLDNFFNKLLNREYLNVIDKYCQLGVKALSDATPKDSGKTASSWDYEIKRDIEKTSIIFTNSNINDGVNIAVILQYGHGTQNGGYVSGIDYVNPSLDPIYEDILKDVWKEVTDL